MRGHKGSVYFPIRVVCISHDGTIRAGFIPPRRSHKGCGPKEP